MRCRNARRAHLDLLAADFVALFVHEMELHERKLIRIFSGVLTQLVDGSWMMDGLKDLAASEKLQTIQYCGSAYRSQWRSLPTGLTLLTGGRLMVSLIVVGVLPRMDQLVVSSTIHK